MSPRKNTESVEYKSTGTFHWKHFTQKGNWHPGVSSTAPRLEFMQAQGSIKEFIDDKKQTKFNVLFDAEYVFEYLYQKIIVNMGWENDGKIDNEVLGYFLKDFANYCGDIEQRKQLAKLRQQAVELSETFPNKTPKEWEEVLLVQLQDTTKENNDTTIKGKTSDEGEHVQNSECEEIYISGIPAHNEEDLEEREILMDDYDADTEEGCGEWKPPQKEDTVTVAAIEIYSEGDIDAEELPAKNTTEEDSPIVPVIATKKRGRPKKS
ncbi:MAG TPA: hypothetical protein VE944_19355 [Nostoc sp.]|uniref:hypothetical protein n=1 Tax=Nostoc sp. TaxID=1180 RepID=UPI002D6D220D|nr:hypothetical protein [Nostoc sp.]HYX16480.1 hypothetical protein [Nostoc sp.]